MYIGILLRLIFGYVRVEVEGYYIERFINICQNKKILIWNLKREKGVKLYFNIPLFKPNLSKSSLIFSISEFSSTFISIFHTYLELV